MRTASLFSSLVLGLLAVSSSGVGLEQRGATPSTAGTGSQSVATAKIVSAAQTLIASLDDVGKGKLQFPLDSPQKTRWSNLPSPMFKREGIRVGDLTQS